MKEIISVNNISKIINNNLILKDINLSIYSGEAFGILGPNGSGKTTLLRTILGLYTPTNGSVSIQGSRLNSLNDNIKRKIGIVLDSNGLYPRLTAYSNLEFYARIYGLNNIDQKIDEVLDYVGLKERKHSRVAEFSLGMLRRLAIARAIIHDPDIVILDEPTNGLDPEGTLLVRNLLLSLKNKGKTVIINSHNLSEVEKICDRIAILHKGQLMLVDTVENVINKNKNVIIDIETKIIPDQLISKLSSSRYVESYQKTETGLQIKLKSSNYINEISKICKDAGVSEDKLKKGYATLEKVFFELTREGDQL